MAHETSDSSSRVLQLPTQVASTIEVSRLVREVEVLDDALIQLGLRIGGKKMSMPKTSLLLDKTIEINQLNLLREADRKELKEFLTAIKSKAPVMHISFGADPSALFIEKLITWLRHEIHPQILLSIGLQPTIGAGCMVRTTNKSFDFTLRSRFTENREMLRDKILASEVAV